MNEYLKLAKVDQEDGENVFLATRVKRLNPAVPEIAPGLSFSGPIIFFPPSDSLINCLQPEKPAAKEKLLIWETGNLFQSLSFRRCVTFGSLFSLFGSNSLPVMEGLFY